MSAAPTHTDNLTDIMEFSREKINEGDYLKLCSFLKNLHSEKADETPASIDITDLNITFEFETYRGKKITLKINQSKKIIYRGSKPNQKMLSGSLQGSEFHKEESELVEQIQNIRKMYGMRNIVRGIEGFPTETFKSNVEYQKYLNARINDDKDVETDELDDCREWNDTYYMSVLLGLDDII